MSASTNNIANYLQQWQAEPERVLYRRFDGNATLWTDIDTKALLAACSRWQAAFTTAGLVAGDKVAICARNSVPWVEVDMAALGLGLVVVPLYVDDNASNIGYCVAHSEAKLLIVDNARIANALQATEHTMPPIWLLKTDEAAIMAASLAAGQSSAEQKLIESAETASAYQCLAVEKNTLATICYTSGTGGRPKGVMLSHGNICANVAACVSLGIARADDVFLSFLPLSHMFERTGGYYLPLAVGATVAHARSVATLPDDLISQQPTALFAVPRIFEKFYARITGAMAESKLKNALFHATVNCGWAIHQGEANIFQKMAYAALRPIIAKKVLARMGGRLRLAVAGGAALEKGIAQTFIGLGLPVLHGYGMTEASPVIAVNLIQGNVPESVGPALPGIQVRLGEHNELQVLGDNVMMGYWNNPEATAASLGAGGWLHTGDVAEMIDGRIYIRGRIKDILVLSNGEKCPPQNMELAISGDDTFEQVMLVGEARPFLTVIAVTQSQAAEKELLKRINDRLKEFPRWMRVRKLITSTEAWTVDNAMLTPTMKVKRANVLKHFEGQLNSIYNESSD